VVNYDALASLASVVIAGFLFYDSGVGFNLLFDEVNWFWFSLITYMFMEIPFVFWYFKKYDVWKTFK
jgi:hypothetical protein